MTLRSHKNHSGCMILPQEDLLIYLFGRVEEMIFQIYIYRITTSSVANGWDYSETFYAPLARSRSCE